MADSRSPPSRFPDAPPQIRALPVDPRGFPIPWFVAKFGDKFDFRVVRAGGVEAAVACNTCWICGMPLGRFKTFVIGPMCGVNRVSSEPPSHPECARFAAKACPFLTQPGAKRNERDLPQERREAPGIMIPRNPGVTLLWSTLRFGRFDAGNGFLFELGVPERVEWFTQGRRATYDEALAAIVSGLPILQEQAEAECPEAVTDLGEAVRRVMPLLPTEFPPISWGRDVRLPHA